MRRQRGLPCFSDCPARWRALAECVERVRRRARGRRGLQRLEPDARWPEDVVQIGQLIPDQGIKKTVTVFDGNRSPDILVRPRDILPHRMYDGAQKSLGGSSCPEMEGCMMGAFLCCHSCRMCNMVYPVAKPTTI